MGVYRHQAWTPRLAKPQAVFLAFQSVSVGIPDAADWQYQRAKPDPVRLPKPGLAAVLSPPAPQTIVFQARRGAADGAYQRRPPASLRQSNNVSAQFLDNPPPAAVILQFPKTAADGAYQRPDPAPTRLPPGLSASLIPSTPIASISGTMSFTITDLTVSILVDRPAATTWTDVATQTTTWTAPLT